MQRLILRDIVSRPLSQGGQGLFFSSVLRYFQRRDYV